MFDRPLREVYKMEVPRRVFYVTHKLFQSLSTPSEAKGSHGRYETRIMPTNNLHNSLLLTEIEVL